MIIWRESKKIPKKKSEAFVDTNQCEEPKVYSSHAVLVRALRDKISSEMAAANEYSQMIESINGYYKRTSGGTAYQNLISIVNRLSEVRNDEENHAGVLLHCVKMLDPEVIKNGVNGLYGKESGDGN